MKFLIPILGLCFLTSCLTSRRCLEKFPPEITIDTVYQVTVRDTTIYRDTTITVVIPGETIRDTILIQPGATTSDTLVVETKWAKASAFYKTPSIHLELVQKDIYFKQKLDSVIKLEQYWKDQTTTVNHNTASIIYKPPTIYKVALWAWIGVIVFIIFRILMKIVKP